MHDQAARTPDAGKIVSLIGCLDSGLQFTDKEGNLHQLVGATSGLNKYVGDVIQVEGTVSESTEPLPSFRVMSARQVSRAAAPRLSAAFRNEATWRAEENQPYGLKFSHPVDFTARDNSDAENESNFPIQDVSTRRSVIRASISSWSRTTNIRTTNKMLRSIVRDLEKESAGHQPAVEPSHGSSRRSIGDPAFAFTRWPRVRVPGL